MMNAARFDPNKFVNLSFAYRQRRCADAIRICAARATIGRAQKRGRLMAAEGEVLGLLLLECLPETLKNAGIL